MRHYLLLVVYQWFEQIRKFRNSRELRILSSVCVYGHQIECSLLLHTHMWMVEVWFFCVH